MQHVAPSTRKLMKAAMSALSKHRGQEALDTLQQVLAINPNHAEALHHIGLILHGAGNHAAAFEFYQRAINADATYVESYLLLSKLLEAQNRGNDAIGVAKRATEIAPNNPQTHCELASLLLRFHRAHDVAPYLAPLLQRFPNHAELRQFYCIGLKIDGNTVAADDAYHALTAKHRVPASFRILYETLIPRLSRSNEEIDAVRHAFEASIDRFIAEKPPLNIGMLSNHPIFALAFHNRDNKAILTKYTRMLRSICPELNYTAPHCNAALAQHEGPIRVGFVSRHMHNHSVGNCYRNVMLYLHSLPAFSVTLFNLADVMDEKMQEINAAGLPIKPVPKNLAAAQELIANERCDILIYPDIGMDAMTHYLAMARLAPHQACFLGHPETTGIDTIDYAIASRSYEPENAAENYTERLLCTASIDTSFARPTPPERWLTRSELGLPEDRILYVCPMSIQKFHPDYDTVLADILARDSTATLVLFNDFQQQSTSDLMRERLLSHCDASRIIFLPWLPLEKLFSVIKTADAMLDTIYFGGGTTAQYAFALGIPIVTMPGAYARGRVVYSYYSLMNIAGAPIAKNTEEYVTMAITLAHDKAYATELSNAILAQNHVLFEAEPYGPKVAQLLRDMLANNLDSYQR